MKQYWCRHRRPNWPIGHCLNDYIFVFAYQELQVQTWRGSILAPFQFITNKGRYKSQWLHFILELVSWISMLIDFLLNSHLDVISFLAAGGAAGGAPSSWLKVGTPFSLPTVVTFRLPEDGDGDW